MQASEAASTVWSIGHSTHAWDAFLALLAANHIQALADVRTVPRSRRHPQFGQQVLITELARQGIEYHHLAELGGWRRPTPASPNGAWRNAAFRGYADYTLTPRFGEGLDALCALACARRVAMMCSEALWWRCHRRLVADQLVMAGWRVLHIGTDGRRCAHQLPAFAVVGESGRLVYPAADRG